eukprot:COSAG05_NODE_1078_length_5954_cov_7.170794_3_plen_164_part_00
MAVLVWTLCNEMAMPPTFKLPGSDSVFGADVFYGVKQALDPSRLMNDQDGACTAMDRRDSLSFCSHQFDIGDLGCISYTKTGGCVGADLPNKCLLRDMSLHLCPPSQWLQETGIYRIMRIRAQLCMECTSDTDCSSWTGTTMARVAVAVAATPARFAPPRSCR